MRLLIAAVVAGLTPLAGLLVAVVIVGWMLLESVALAGESSFPEQPSQPNSAVLQRPVAPQRYQPQVEPSRIVEEIPNTLFQTQAARAGEATLSILRLDLPPPASVTVEQMASKKSDGGPSKIGFNRRIADFLERSLAVSQSWRWQAQAGGEQIARLQVTSPGAAALRVGLRVRGLPATGELRFYSGRVGQGRAYRISAKHIVQLVSTNQSAGVNAGENPEVYWSPTLEGDQAVVEVRVPSRADLNEVDLEIDAVSHLTVDPRQSSSFLPAAAARCNLDVNCYSTLSQNGDDISNAVAKMVFTSGTYTGLCSGTLLADRANSKIPFFLTARHCVSTAAEASSLETVWFYESASCNSSSQSANTQFRSGGASVLETYANNDMTLLRLNEQPPAGAVYAGWNWDAEGDRYTAIHHPEGDWKKISFGASQSRYQCLKTTGDQVVCNPSSDGTYFRMFIDKGFTEQGSSGSGVFKDNAYLVGTLTAGSGTCNDAYAVYGRLQTGYDNGLGKWLENKKIGFLDNPQPGSYQSGITVVSGWACVPGAAQDAPEIGQVTIEIDGSTVLRASYGTPRTDTQSVCGDTNNGFGLLVNTNRLGTGSHSLRALADGYEIGRASFTVTTLGTEFLRGASATYQLPDFPKSGQNVVIRWQESLQNFVISARNVPASARQNQHAPAAAEQRAVPELQPLPSAVGAVSAAPAAVGRLGYLENPQPDSYQSGITIFSGWTCQPGVAIKRVDVEIDGSPWQAGYGTERLDTSGTCGDADNGWGLLFNTNVLGDGQHTARALADGLELGRATFTVVTLGGDFIRGLSGSYQLKDFPKNGDSVGVIWQESLQNFTIKSASVR
ncbi:MAG: trypsin-like peptidase domain-containing protein [Candidatus Competibacteraceae bacterium]|nr:trypsin-like peptidase domain-containing protein [Candidatus Competibacteraceae bacterium]